MATTRQTVRVVLDVTVDDDEYAEYFYVPVVEVGPRLADKIALAVGRIVGVKRVTLR